MWGWEGLRNIIEMDYGLLLMRYHEGIFGWRSELNLSAYSGGFRNGANVQQTLWEVFVKTSWAFEGLGKNVLVSTMSEEFCFSVAELN